jgi:hypothetical protein
LTQLFELRRVHSTRLPTANYRCSVRISHLLAPTNHNHYPLASSQVSHAFSIFALLGSSLASHLSSLISHLSSFISPCPLLTVPCFIVDSIPHAAIISSPLEARIVVVIPLEVNLSLNIRMVLSLLLS